MNKVKQIFKLTTALTTSISVFASSSVYAEAPSSAKVTEVLGANSMKLRRYPQGSYDNVDRLSVMEKMDRLDIPSNGKDFFAKLEFYDSTEKPMGLTVQASIKNDLKTSYYFPCRIDSSGPFIIQWTNEKTKNQACEQGFKISQGKAGGTKKSELGEPILIAFSKEDLIAQSAPSSYLSCAVAGSKSGRSWYGITSSADPCEEPLKLCKDSGEKECVQLTVDRWFRQNPELTALVTCASGQEFKAKGDGSKIKDEIGKLWQQVETEKAKQCGLYVLKPDDIIVLPPPASQTKADPKAKNQSTVVQINPKEGCFDVDLYEGNALVKSAGKTDGVNLQRGDRYNYCKETVPDTTTKFDPTVESIDLQIFRATKRGYKLCDQENASGGQLGDTRTIQLTSTKGTLNFKYDMLSVPDRLEVIYENQTILDTGFISGSGELSVPFEGKSGQVTVKLTGNREISSTQWSYILYCPQEN